MGLLSKIGIAAFIGVNAKIFFRLITSLILIFIFNLIYVKYEALLLATSPEKLFIPLYIYTAIVMSLILWTLISFKFFSSFKEAEKKIEIKNSFINKPNDYEKIRDVTKHPTLKSFKDKLVSHE
jgi:hypothetical protein